MYDTLHMENLIESNGAAPTQSTATGQDELPRTAIAESMKKIIYLANAYGFSKQHRRSVLPAFVAKLTQLGAAVVTAARGRLVKVILETALLGPEPIRQGCQLALEAGAGFVKTSTGFGLGGVTREAVALLRQAVGDKAGVKAAGGIRDTATARMLIEAGATRLGTSASLAILAGPKDVT
jgi:deoxyribose-phosphate aldolase